MKIAILGAGFIGKRIHEATGYPLIKKRIQTMYDLKHLVGYEVIINAAGLASVDECSENEEKAYQDNTILPLILRLSGKKIYHISTGCLLNGPLNINSKNIKTETVYGESKLIGEQVLGDNCVIRIRLPYSDKPHKREFLTKLAGFRSVHNKRNSLTSIEGLIDDLVYLIKNNKKGIYHSVHDTNYFTNICKMIGIKKPVTIQTDNRVNVLMSNNIQKVKDEYTLEETIKRRFHGAI